MLQSLNKLGGLVVSIMPITYLFSRDSPINFPLGLKLADVDGSHVPGVLLKEKTQMTQIKEASEGC